MLVLLAFSTYYVSQHFVIAQAFIQVSVLGYFILLSRQYPQVRTHGWSYILVGVNLVTFGALVEISSFVPFLRSPLTQEGAVFRQFLRQVVGNNTGLLLIAYGFYRWVPSFLASRRVVDELLRKYEQQVVRNEKLNSLAGLVAGVAHELNNPLSIVLGYTDVLAESCASEKERAAIEELKRATQRCKKIASNLLAFACQPVTERQPVAVPAIVDEALELLASPLKRHGITLEREPAAGIPPVMGDRDQLLQVFFNLLQNAIQALAGREGARVLTIACATDEVTVRVAITDSGPGIPAELLDKIFQPFFTTKQPGEGTGLGLSVCFGIVKAHGGSIKAESQPGVLTRFTCELPAAPSPAAAGAASGPEETADLRGLEILLVDDEEALVVTNAEYLARKGARVDTSTSVPDALDRLGDNDYDAVVLDVRMPCQGGAELYSEICHRFPGIAARVIFATGDAGHDDTVRFLRSTDRPYILKPFSGHSLGRLIARHARRGRPA